MASTGEAVTWRLGHRPALDGVRGLAILLVLAGHLYLPGALGAPPVGVTVFFTLSGFLITSLLLERDEGLGRFYLRRAARLGPALMLAVTGYVILRLLVVGNLADWGMILGAVTYTSNWLRMTDVYVAGQTGLSHLWSLAVEEQFYLLWPLLLALITRLRKHWALLVVGYLIVLSLIDRVSAYWAHGFMRAYNGIDTRADELLIGCALAIALHGGRERRMPAWVMTVPVVPVVALSAFGEPISVTLMPTVAAALTAATLYGAVNGGGASWSRHPWLIWLGQHSYAIYLFHVPIRWAIQQQVDLWWWLLAPATLAMAVPAAALSWRYVEQPVLAAVRQRAIRSPETASRGTGRLEGVLGREIVLDVGDLGRVELPVVDEHFGEHPV